MEIKRYNSKLGSFHCVVIDEPRESPAPELNVNILLLDIPVIDQLEDSCLGLKVSFNLFFPKFDLVGTIEQVVKISGKLIETETDLTNEEMSELLDPLFQDLDFFSQGIQSQMSNYLNGESYEI